MVSPPEAIMLSTVPFRDITQASLVWEQQGLPEHRRGGATENREQRASYSAVDS